VYLQSTAEKGTAYWKYNVSDNDINIYVNEINYNYFSINNNLTKIKCEGQFKKL
jgi:hypothetical protein